MHPENKLTNHGKQVTSGAQSQLPNVNQQQQGPPGNLGSKGTGVGNHGVKPNQISPGAPGLKSVGQSGGSVGVGGMLKTKAKRERSVSLDTGDQKDALTPANDPEAKVEGVMRSKRRCVLEKKQPYSGDEWCSGPDTEEEEDKPPSITHRERPMGGAGQSLSGPSGGGGVSEKAGPAQGCGLGPGLRSELSSRPAQQMVYVFTTSLANSAAEAVIQGHADSILLFHQQNVPRTKLDQCVGIGKVSSLSEQLCSSGTPPMGTPKSQSGTPRPASVGGMGGGHLPAAGTPSSTGHPDGDPTQPRQGGTSSSSSAPPPGSGGSGPQPQGSGQGAGVSEGPGPLAHPAAGVSPSSSSSVLSAHLQGEAGQRGAPVNVDGLSKEQLEHRERSLQRLRDIERLFLRSNEPGGPNGNPNNNNNADNAGAPVNNNNNSVEGGVGLEDGGGGENGRGCHGNGASMAGVKKYEEPLQSMISQTQSLGGAGLEEPMMGPQHHDHGLPPHPHHHHLHPHLSSPSGLDMAPLLGPEGLTPEQVAWRKLQEEYYQEKRRQQQEMHPQHFRMMSEMGMSGGPPPIMMRGPPPPYHSKPGDQQWGPGPMMGPGMGGNARIMDMHPEGPRGPRFLGPMPRGPPGGGGYPGSPGGVLGMEGMGPQRPPRPGMGWLEELPSNMGGGGGGGGGPFHGCYPPGGPGGPPQHLQGDPDRLLTREEMFRIMEKRQLHRMELERLAKQQQAGLGGHRMMENPGGPGFPPMGGGPPSRGDPMDFPGSRAMMGSPVGGAGGGGVPPMRDMIDSPLGGGMGMGLTLNAQQQMLAQRLRAGHGGVGALGEMLSPEDISRLRAGQNGRGGANKMVISGPEGPLHFPHHGPFPGGGPGEGPYLQQPGHDMFGPDQPGPPQMGGTSRLSHMPMGPGSRGVDLGPRHPSDLSINVNPMGSPVMPPPNQHKSPSLSQDASPLMPSPSAPGLKSPSQLATSGPSHPPLPAASGAGTPSSTSMKSPQVMGPSLGLRSPSSSPGHLKSPAMAVASPGWTASPKTTLPSPGGLPSGKGGGNGGSSSTETGHSLPPRSSNSTPISQPGSLNPSMPFTSSPDAPPSQNPLSLIMSQMSKYAMPSSTPLYHEAIKTIATSDDEMPPDRPMLAGVNMQGAMGNHQSNQMLLSSQGSMGPHSGPQSPMGMVLQGGQQLSHDPSGPMLPSPNPMGMPGMNPGMMGGGGHPDGMGPCNVSPMHLQTQMGGFPRMPAPSHGPLPSPIGGMGQQYHGPEDVLPPHLLGKGLSHQRPPHPPDAFPPMSVGEGPDLSEVIRPSHTGIPEFDLSRIIPADKPSSTLQYFPKSESLGPPPPQSLPQTPPPQQLLKQLSAGPPPPGSSSGNPHIANLQNMMAEQQLPLHPSHCGLRTGMPGPQGGIRGVGSGGGGMCHPGHMMGRTAVVSQQQHLQHPHQAMMANSLLQQPSHHPAGMMSPQQSQHTHSLMAQQNLQMMMSKQRGMPLAAAEHFGQQGALMSPQGPMMGPQHPQPGMMGPQTLRQRGMSLDSPLGYGPGSMANMPF